MDKPIPEAVRALADELMEASEYEDDLSVRIAYADASGRVRTLADALTATQQPDHIVDATKMVAQQQGQADEEAAAYEQAHRAGESHGRIMAALEQPMQQGGGEVEFKERVADMLPRGTTISDPEVVAERLMRAHAASFTAPPSAPVGVKSEPGAVRLLVAAANAVLALYPGDDQLWTLESAVRPFNATKPAECAGGCPPQQVCDYCQIASLAQQPAAVALSRKYPDDGNGEDDAYNRGWNECLDALATQHQEPTT